MIGRLLLLTILFVGCAVKEPSKERQNSQVVELSSMIISLSPQIDTYEARELAKKSIGYSLALAKQYEAIASPWIQNTLVNVGIKERGLCHEWAEDLWNFLATQNYRTLEIHPIGANIGYLSEHNALAVSAKGEGVEKSILLDAWRGSGNLYFKKIEDDKKYEWYKREGLYDNLK